MRDHDRDHAALARIEITTLLGNVGDTMAPPRGEHACLRAWLLLGVRGGGPALDLDGRRYFFQTRAERFEAGRFNGRGGCVECVFCHDATMARDLQ